MFKKEMTEEQRLAKEAAKANKRAKRAARREKFLDGLAEVGGVMAPIAVPILAIAGASLLGSMSANKKEKNKKREQDEYDDLLAQGKGFTGRKDPKWIAYQYDQANRIEENEEDIEEDEEEI